MSAERRVRRRSRRKRRRTKERTRLRTRSSALYERCRETPAVAPSLSSLFELSL